LLPPLLAASRISATVFAGPLSVATVSAVAAAALLPVYLSSLPLEGDSLSHTTPAAAATAAATTNIADANAVAAPAHNARTMQAQCNMHQDAQRKL
jgi:hypothetical protein